MNLAADERGLAGILKPSEDDKWEDEMPDYQREKAENVCLVDCCFRSAQLRVHPRPEAQRTQRCRTESTSYCATSYSGLATPISQ